LKAIIYIIVLIITINACGQHDQVKNTVVHKTYENSEKSTSDTLTNNEETLNTSVANPIQKLELKTIADIENTNNYFKLLSATYENWTAGIPNGGSGTEYYFKIKITTYEKIAFDSVWVNNKAFEIFIFKENGSVSSSPIKYGNSDIIMLRASDLKNSMNVKPPINYTATALVGYLINGERKYLTIKEITKQSTANRP
jgi:hypothetical protein